jgi:hypothetical protein
VTTEHELLPAVAHRLRAAIAVLLGYGELALVRDESVRAEALVAMREVGARLVGGIDDLVLALGLAWGALDVALEPVDLGEAVADAAEQFGRGVSVEARSEARVVADTERLDETLNALLRAAGGAARVSVEAPATVAIEPAEALDEEGAALALLNARRLAELQRGSLRVEPTRLELTLEGA